MTPPARRPSGMRTAESRAREGLGVFENLNEVFFVVSSAGRVVHYISPGYEKIWGRSCESLYKSPQSWLEAVHSDDRERVRKRLEKCAALEMECRVVRPDGEVRWISIRTFGAKSVPGQPPRLAGIAEDVTGRKNAELEVRRLTSAVEKSGEVIFMTDAEGVFIYVNPEFTRLYGYEPGEVIGRCTPSILKVGGRGSAEYEDFWQRIRRKEVVRGDWSNRSRDGRVVDVNYSVSPILDEGGRLAGFLSVQRDVTAVKAAVKELRASEERYRSLMENAPDGILVQDCDTGLFTDFNASALALFGLTPEECARGSLAGLSPERQPDGRPSAEAAAEYVRAALDGEKPVFEWTFHSKSGRDVPCEVRLARLPEENRRLVRGSVTDISRRKTLEDQFRQAQKMEAIGRLAGGVAHDFNNLLTVILGFSGMLRAGLPAGDPRRNDAEEIVRAAERATALTRQLLVFSRKNVVRTAAIGLNDTLAQMQKLLRRVIGEDISLEVFPGEELGFVLSDAGQVEQVVMNLVVNARDAMPSGGKIVIETRNVTLGDQEAWGLKDVVPGPYVMLAVSDTGSGMTEEAKSHLFEPFFTTKEAGKGTGLGLSTVYAIVRQAGGHIAVHSEPGLGTCFKVYFPRVQEGAAAAAEAAPSEPAGGAETLFLVEDEKAVCALAEKVLRAKGYRVITAAGPREALELAGRMERPPELLVTDVVMPDMGGVPLSDQLRARWPGLKTLYVSGYTEGRLSGDDLAKGGRHFLPKPFSPGDLARAVRETLDS